MKNNISRWALIFLLFFNAAGAYYGSFMLISDPTGGDIQMPAEMLQGSPFQDFLVPGIVLLLVNGLLPTIAFVGLVIEQPQAPLLRFFFFKKHLWAWSLALLSGIGLMIWIVVQVSLLNSDGLATIQLIYGALGVVITGLTLLPSVRNYYTLRSGT